MQSPPSIHYGTLPNPTTRHLWEGFLPTSLGPPNNSQYGRQHPSTTSTYSSSTSEAFRDIENALAVSAVGTLYKPNNSRWPRTIHNFMMLSWPISGCFLGEFGANFGIKHRLPNYNAVDCEPKHLGRKSCWARESTNYILQLRPRSATEHLPTRSH